MANTTNGTNGNGKIQQWVVNALFTICLAIGGFYFQNMEKRQTVAEQQDARQNERIAVLENEVSNLKDLINKGFDRMDKKLDELPQRLHK